MGRGLPAATVMGQIRTAIRSYAMLDLPPAEVMRHVSELAGVITGNQFITCVYAVHDPVEATLTYANAGHLPPAVVDPAGQVRFLTERLGMPLRVGHAFNQRQVEFPAGSSLVLYTDGLVERRRKPLSDGIEKLRAALIALSGRPVADAHVACDDLIRELAGGLYDDDVALLYLRDLGAHRRAATMALTVDPAVAAHARRFATAALTEWGFAGAKDQVQMIVTELVANAVKHSQMPVKLRLYQAGDRLVIDVMDRDRRVPQRMDPALDEEHHRGLFIVDAYAERWGSRPTADGKVVWAEVLLPTTSPTPRPGPGHPSNAGSPRPA
jgi:anti-sigma regulatory factor (Ser/Thr protein kinase)